MLQYIIYERTSKGEIIHNFDTRKEVVEFLKENLASITSICALTPKGEVIELYADTFLIAFAEFIQFK